MPLSPEQLLAGYQRSVAVTRDQTLRYGVTLWNLLPAYRDADIDRFVASVVPKVRAGQYRTATLTAAYMAGVARLRGEPVPTVAVDRAVISGVRAVAPETEYRRPAVTVYGALSKGKTLDTAVGMGLDRLQSLITTDLQLAKTTQASLSLQSGGYTYYRRVLTGSENCALCSIASTQRYKVGDLMPIHGGCDCGIDRVTSKWEPPQVLEPQLLEDTHARVEAFTGIADRGGRSPDYRELLITHTNSETGPTLAWRGQHFEGRPAVMDDI